MRIQRICISEGDGTRTRNHRIDSPTTPRSKSKQCKQITPPEAAGCAAGCTSEQGEGGIPDPELLAIVNAWPKLPAHIKAAFMALLTTLEMKV